MFNNRILFLEEEIRHHDYHYYTKQAPQITDPEYDALVVELRDLYDNRIPESSVLFKPGVTLPMPGRVEKMHDRPMISLRTEVDTTVAPIETFHKKVLEVNPNPRYVAEYKYDGLAVSLKVTKNRIRSAVLRGDGEKGEDVWDNIRYIANIPTHIYDHTVTEIRGEVVMLRSRFREANKFREEIGKSLYANPRNAVSGIVRSLPGAKMDLWSNALPGIIAEGLVFIPYSVFRTPGAEEKTQLEDLLILSELFKSMYFVLPSETLGTPEELYRAYEIIEEKRSNIGFDIDGVVYKVNDPETRKKMGTTGREPNWAIAHKYKAERAETRLLAIDVQVGPSGRLTPVARLYPVFVGGVTVTNVTLSNVFQIRKKKIRVGDMVVVQRAGDVIPEILGPARSNYRREYVPNFRLRHECPECKTELRRQKEMVHTDCPNWNCPAQVKGRLTEAFGRTCLDVEGIGPSTISNIVDFLGVRDVYEVLDLTEDELGRAGIGDADSKSIADGIADLRENPIAIDRVIRAFGIPKVGQSASRKLAPYIDGWRTSSGLRFGANKVKLNEDVLAAVNDAERTMQVEMCALLSRLNVVQPPAEREGKLKDKLYAMTGGHATLSRPDLQDLIISHGGKITGSPNKMTTAYLVGSGASAAKVDKARKLGVEIIDINDFVDSLKD